MDAIVYLILASSVSAAIAHPNCIQRNGVRIDSRHDRSERELHDNKVPRGLPHFVRPPIRIRRTRRPERNSTDLEGRILVAESKHQKSSFVRLGTLAVQARWKEFTARCAAHRPALDMNYRISQ